MGDDKFSRHHDRHRRRHSTSSSSSSEVRSRHHSRELLSPHERRRDNKNIGKKDSEHRHRHSRNELSSEDERRKRRRKGREDSPKIAKKEISAQRAELIKSRFGYTDESNPFNDPSLSKVFVWKKKARKEGVPASAASCLTETKIRLNEITSAKERRENRNKELEIISKQQADLAREKQAENFAELLDAETNFLNEVTKLRNELRIQNKRETILDLLVKGLKLSSPSAAFVSSNGEISFSDFGVSSDFTPDEFELSEFDSLDLTLLHCAIDEWFKTASDSAIVEVMQGVVERRQADEADVVKMTILLKERQDECSGRQSDDINDENNIINNNNNLFLESLKNNPLKLISAVKKDTFVIVTPRRLEEIKRWVRFWKALEIVARVERMRRNPERRDQRLDSASRRYDEETKQLIPSVSLIIQEQIISIIMDFVNMYKIGEIDKESILENQLDSLLRSQQKNSDAFVLDVEYWDSVKQSLPFYKSVCLLRKVHSMAVSNAKKLKVIRRSTATYSDMKSISESSLPATMSEGLSSDINMLKMARGGLSPVLIPYEQFFLDHPSSIVEDDEDINLIIDEIVTTESSVDAKGRIPELSDDEDSLSKLQKRGIPVGVSNEDETDFDASNEYSITETYSWADKHNIRKPKYFNTVKSGFEWNSYNQSHYGPDNLPPRVVQGYRFNILYPDLILKRSPTWKLMKSEDPDAIILRFSGGPPYSDLAFKIVNREWDLRSGFKNIFDRGVLQLHFNFKRYRYRK